MSHWVEADFPAALTQARRKIEQWRGRHRPRARIPEDLWREAAQLACAHGINRTARALRLDYYALKKRVAGATPAGEGIPEFVEVLPGGLAVPPPECLIEVEDARGGKMRIHLPGGERPDLVALVGVFREGRS